MRGNAFYHKHLMLVLLILLSITSCENGGKFSNAPPSDLSIVRSKCYIWTGGEVELTGDAIDGDGDPITFLWSCSGGSLDPSEGATVTWSAPAEPGEYTIVLTVTDEIDESSIHIDMPVGAVFPFLSGNLEITDEGYPYVVTSQGRVSVRGDLTLGPGVTIIIDDPFGGFTVTGTLTVNGTKDSPVEIFANDCEPGAGLWGGIVFMGVNAEGNLNNIQILSPKYGVEAADGARLTMDSCTVYSASVEGIHIVNNSRATVTHCRIENNKVGIYVQNSDVTISNTSIRYNSQYGAQISGTDQFTTSLEACTISNNGVDGVNLSYQASPEIHNCSLYANGTYAIRLENGYEAADSVQAQNNFWGLGHTTEAAISEVLYDGNDHVSIIGYIDFTPWLKESPGGFRWIIVEDKREVNWRIDGKDHSNR